jgi:hypothetical protein
MELVILCLGEMKGTGICLLWGVCEKWGQRKDTKFELRAPLPDWTKPDLQGCQVIIISRYPRKCLLRSHSSFAKIYSLFSFIMH